MKKLFLISLSFFATISLMTSCSEKNATENASSNATEVVSNSTTNATENVKDSTSVK